MRAAFRTTRDDPRLERRRLRLGLLLVLGASATATAATTAPAALANPLVASRAQPLSDRTPFPEACLRGQPQKGSEAAPAVAVNPRDPRHVAVAWEQDLKHERQAMGIVTAVSRDGARSFQRAIVPGLSGCSGGEHDLAIEPTLAFGADGVLYLATLASPDNELNTSLQIVRSADGGTSWDPPATIANNSPNGMVVADPTLPGRAYLALTAKLPQGTVLQLARTDDGGRSWSTPRPIHQPLTENPSLDDMTILPDGRMLVVFQQSSRTDLAPGSDASASRPILAFSSSDQGATWSEPVELGRVEATLPRDPEPDSPGAGSGVVRAPTLATAAPIDGGAAVAWQSNTSVDDGRILLSRSGDGGTSWSEPTPSGTSRAQVFTPELATGPGGVLGLSWYDFHADRKGDKPLTTTARFAHSHDGGASWIGVGIGSPFDLRQSYDEFGRTLGIRQGLAPLAGGFAAAFVQTPPETVAGLSDVFLTRLTPAPPSVRLRVNPRRARAGRRVRFRFQLTTGASAASRPVSGGRISFAGQRARTDRRGRAAITVTLRRPGRYRARATKPRFAPATTTVTAAASSRPGGRRAG